MVLSIDGARWIGSAIIWVCFESGKLSSRYKMVVGKMGPGYKKLICKLGPSYNSLAQLYLKY